MRIPQNRGSLAGSSASSDRLSWLVRYANHCGFLDGSQADPTIAIKNAFSSAGWRILCRSTKVHFIPIIRNRDLSFDDLVKYCNRLAECSFVKAPAPELLEYFVRQRRTYFHLRCRIPQEDDYILMRIAQRQQTTSLPEVALVCNWVYQEGVELNSRQTWAALLSRAKSFREQERIKIASTHQSRWDFFCDDHDWRGFRIEPIRDSAQLWIEGIALGNCLYKLRHECNSIRPSRFFCIRRAGKRVATLELSWVPPQKSFIGMQRELGCWQVCDLRLSYNRLPDESLREAMFDFAKMYSIWALRPNRMHSGYVQKMRQKIARLQKFSFA